MSKHVTGTFTCLGGVSSGACNPSLTASRGGHAAELLIAGPNAGKVLLAGGLGAPNGVGTPAPQSSAELFNSATQKFAAAKPLGLARAFASAFVVP